MNNHQPTKNTLRYERKFHPAYIDPKEMQLLISLHPYGFYKPYPDREINNVYLDTVELSSYIANVEGFSPRSKYRVRWYGDVAQEYITPVLEVKRKFGLVGDKIRFPLNGFDSRQGIKEETIKYILTSTEDESGYCALTSRLKCALFNRYIRSYFVSHDGNFRLTVDRNLIYSPFRDKHVDFSFVAKDPNIIIELKYAVGYEKQAETITKNFSLRVEKISKYVQGIQLFNQHFIL